MRFTSLICVLRLTIVAGFVVGPVLFASHQQKQMKNFRVVREGVLYRSGQMSLAGLRRAVHDHGIRTVVSLRDARNPGDSPPDAVEEEFCQKLDILHVRITPRPWEDPDGKPAPVSTSVKQFLAVMNDPNNYPVLLHCFAGTHRTGAYCAVYRMEFEGWTSEEALTELRSLGYPHVAKEKDIHGYLSNYRVSPLEKN